MIPFHKPDLTDLETMAVIDTMASGQIAVGPRVERFERAVAEHVGVPYAVAVSSCTTGFACLWAAIGVEPNDPILFPSYTFAGPAMTALQAQANVILADSRDDDPMMSAESASEIWLGDPLVIVPTMFRGDPVPEDLYQLAKTHDVPLILDAAMGFGSRLTSESGLKPWASVFSFYATKPLTTGTGGMILTHDQGLAEELRSTRNHGFATNVGRPLSLHERLIYDVERPGFKANLPELAAAIGLVQLSRVNAMRTRREQIAVVYSRHLDKHGIKHSFVPPGGNTHLYTIDVPSKQNGFVEYMAKCGIQVSAHFRPLHLHTFWREVNDYREREALTLPNAERHWHGTISLPISSALTDEEVYTVIEAVTTWGGW